MNKEVQIEMLKARIATLEGRCRDRGCENQGIVAKLKRKLRKLEQ